VIDVDSKINIDRYNAVMGVELLISTTKISILIEKGVE